MAQRHMDTRAHGSHIPHNLFCDLKPVKVRLSAAVVGSEQEGNIDHTCSGNLPTLVPPNFWTTHPLGQLFLTTDFILASPIENVVGVSQ